MWIWWPKPGQILLSNSRFNNIFIHKSKIKQALTFKEKFYTEAECAYNLLDQIDKIFIYLANFPLWCGACSNVSHFFLEKTVA